MQEIYTATSLSLKTTSNKALDISYGSGGTLPGCTSNTQKDNNSKKTANQKGATPGNAGSGQSQAKNAGSSANKSNEANSSPTSSSTNGISVGACRNSDFAMTLKSDAAIPFAVRLNEVVLNSAGDLEIKYGSFKLPQSLGNSDVEKQTALIDDQNTPLTGLQRIDRAKR